LDVTIQAQIMELLGDLKRRLGMSILLITHNLALLKEIADRILVMYAGQIVEEGPALSVLNNPLHPYTRALLRSTPMLGAGHERLISISGNVPHLGAWPSGCRFHPRCPQRQPPCKEEVPLLLQPDAEHKVRCPFWQIKSIA
jgi:oligopeptide/dipeptide ABC transporter ATP-binding protein